jgi:2-dehydropantoate 2-reductase
MTPNTAAPRRDARNKDHRRILIAGAGALGSVFGGFLRRGGHAVTLLGRAAHLDAIGARGLHIDGLWGEHCVRGFALTRAAAELTDTYDAILIAAKAYDTAAVVDAVAPYLSDDGVMISVQNGLGNVEAIAARAGAARTLGARVIFGAEAIAAGQVRVTVYAEPVLIGALRAGRHPDLDARAGDWAARMTAVGIPTQYCPDITAALWGKVLYNAALNPLGALLGVHYGALTEEDNTRAVMDTVIDEAFAVATAEGVRLPWASAAEYRRVFYGRLVPATFHHRASMLQDLERGRRTEVDAINGQVWKRGAACGIATPANELLTHLVHARESASAARR